MRIRMLCVSLSVLVAVFSLNAQNSAPKPPQGPPTVAEAEQFIKGAEDKLNDLATRQAHASWVQSNFIT